MVYKSDETQLVVIDKDRSLYRVIRDEQHSSLSGKIVTVTITFDQLTTLLNSLNDIFLPTLYVTSTSTN